MFPHMSHDPQAGDLYFAYGSNLDLQRLTVWCLDAGFGEPSLDVIGPAWLPDRRLAFTRFSPGWHGGVADAVAAPGCVLQGLLLRVRDEETWRALDAKEGVPSAYQRLAWTALLPDGRSLPVWTYVVAEPVAFVPPAPDYLQVLRRGRAAWQLALDELEAAATNQPQPLRPPLFVYGTLRRGERNAGLLGIVSRRAAVMAGQLWHVACDPPYPYPAMTLCGPRSDDRVRGELVDPAAERWTDLDDLEGFSGFSRDDGHLYRRLLLPARELPGGQSQLCFVYAMDQAPSGPRIASGDWQHRAAA